jgi:hypothetical protein
MTLTVKERGQYAATLRQVQVTLMETLAAWVPTTPEMEVKLLFGEHVYDTAQHADAFGKRTFELRLPLHHGLPPSYEYEALLADIAALVATPQRIAAMYDVLLPGLAERYRHYIGETDTLLDAPSVRILKQVLFDTDRMLDQSRTLRHQLPELAQVDSDWMNSLRQREVSIQQIVGTPVEAMAEVG